ncbi:MAG: hypothetical protein KatS3mg015_0912 [Fimbriimonadales bacterium]|nr:MAG: hypothetical protein KatS3mg015_0912 [Fimbriimonadales bacterium]
MSQPDPWALRREGKPEEALQLAREILEVNPEDSSVRQCAFWCLYDLAKPDLEKVKELGRDQADGDVNRLIASCADRLSEMMEYYQDDDTQRSTVGWFAARCALQAARRGEEAVVVNLVKAYRKAVPTPTAEVYHSLLLSAILQLESPPPWFGKFLQYWNLANLQEDDYKGNEFETPEGKRVKGRSLAARAVSAAAKFFAENPNEESGWFDMAAREILARVRDDTWIAYHFAKYLLARGRSEEALPYLDHALEATRGNAAAWSLLSSAFEAMGYADAAVTSAVEACNRDATVCGRKPYEMIAQALEGKDPERAAEWREFANTFADVWRANTPDEQRENQKQFSKRVRAALERSANLLESIPWSDFVKTGRFTVGVGVVETINPEKKAILVRRSGEDRPVRLYVGFAMQDRIKKSGPGTVLELLMSNPPRTIYAARFASGDQQMEGVREMTGRVRRKAEQPFAFVDQDGLSAYIPPELVARHKLTDQATVKVKVMKSIDPKKGKEGWRVIHVVSTSEGG